MHGQLRCRPRLFGGKLHRQLRLRKKRNKKNNFEDDKISFYSDPVQRNVGFFLLK